MKPGLRHLIAVALATQLVLTPPSRAAVISDIQPVDRAELRAKLEDRGVSDAESLARVEALTESEARQLATHIDALPAGAASPVVILYGFYLLLYALVAGVASAL